jgi:hypothetical protein
MHTLRSGKKRDNQAAVPLSLSHQKTGRLESGGLRQVDKSLEFKSVLCGGWETTSDHQSKMSQKHVVSPKPPTPNLSRLVGEKT